MTPPRRALIVMAKQPIPGETKTRLVPHVTPSASARLYECFLLDTLEKARALSTVETIVAVSPEEAFPYFEGIAPDLSLVLQQGETLGERLNNVLVRCLEEGFAHVAAIGSDVPTLPSWHLSEAFEQLADDRVDVVLGPSDDGGYHLIGWKRHHPRLVREVEMSTPRVLKDTLALAALAGLKVSLLPPWYDIDEPDDLERLVADVRAGSAVGTHTRGFLEQYAAGGME